MKSILLVNGPWDIEIINLIEQGLSDREIIERVPFRSDYVTNLRKSLNINSEVRMKGV